MRTAAGRAWLVAGVAFTVLALLGGGVGVWSILAALVPVKTTTQHADYTQSTSEIQISLANGNISLAAAAGAGVRLDRTLTWQRNPPDVRETWSGGTLRISTACTADCTADYVLDVPPGTQIQARTAHGTITTTGLTGTQDLASAAGAITVSGATGQLTAQTLSGDITALGLRCAWSSLHTASGAVAAQYLTTPDQVTADSDAGDIAVSVPDNGMHYRVLAFTATGSPDVGLAQSQASTSTIAATTLAGTVRIGYR